MLWMAPFLVMPCEFGGWTDVKVGPRVTSGIRRVEEFGTYIQITVNGRY